MNKKTQKVYRLALKFRHHVWSTRFICANSNVWFIQIHEKPQDRVDDESGQVITADPSTLTSFRLEYP